MGSKWSRRVRIPLVLTAVAAVAMQIPSASAAPTPATPHFGPAIEGLSPVQSEAGCNPTVRPGTLALGGLLNATYPGHVIYYVAPCNNEPTSGHHLGRAIDFMTTNAAQEADAQAFMNWLFATDQYGNRFAMARRLGVMYLIHNRKIWTSSSGGKWASYTGSNPHTNHVHISLNNAGANKTTSFWTSGGAPNLVDGTFILASGSPEVYVMAGGAPIYVSTWANVGGSKPLTVLSQSEFNRLAYYPADGTFIRAVTTGEVYVMVGGAPIYVSTWANVGGSKPSVGIDIAAIANAQAGGAWNHLRQVPADGTYIVGRSTGQVFVIAKGTPIYVSNWANVGGARVLTAVDQEAVVHADGGRPAQAASHFSHLNALPADGSLIRGFTTGAIYTIAGGAPIYVSTSDALGSPIANWVDVDESSIAQADAPFTTPPGAYDNPRQHLAMYPSRGMCLVATPKNATSKYYWTGAGTYMKDKGDGYVTSVDAQVCSGLPTAAVDPAALQNAGSPGFWSHILGVRSN